MATETKLGLVLAVIQEKASVGAVGFVTRETLSILNRSMHQLLLPKFIMTNFTEISPFGGKPKTFTTLERMFLNRLLVTGRTVSICNRLMEIFKSSDSSMTGCG